MFDSFFMNFEFKKSKAFLKGQSMSFFRNIFILICVLSIFSIFAIKDNR